MTPIEPFDTHDYRPEREDARRANQWRYPTPGQWVDGEWREYSRAEAEADR